MAPKYKMLIYWNNGEQMTKKTGSWFAIGAYVWGLNRFVSTQPDQLAHNNIFHNTRRFVIFNDSI